MGVACHDTRRRAVRKVELLGHIGDMSVRVLHQKEHISIHSASSQCGAEEKDDTLCATIQVRAASDDRDGIHERHPREPAVSPLHGLESQPEASGSG